jgi:hypothetical protein
VDLSVDLLEGPDTIGLVRHNRSDSGHVAGKICRRGISLVSPVMGNGVKRSVKVGRGPRQGLIDGQIT